MYGAHFARQPTAVAELLMCMLLRRGLFYRYIAPFTVKHSGKLNWTKLNWAVQFSSVSRCALNRPRSAMIRRRNWRSSQVLHNRGTLSWIGQSIIGRKSATRCNDRFLTVAGHRSSSPVQCTSRNWTQLNWSQLNDPVQFSSVFGCALGFTWWVKMNIKNMLIKWCY